MLKWRNQIRLKCKCLIGSVVSLSNRTVANPQTVCQKRTIKYESRRELSVVKARRCRLVTASFSVNDSLLKRKESAGKTSSRTKKKAESWTQQAWIWGLRCRYEVSQPTTPLTDVISVWFVSQISESEIYSKKNRCFHAVPDSIWEDNSRNCGLGRI